MSLNKILAVLLVVIFVIFTLVVILAWSVKANILNDEAYVTSLDKADFFEFSKNSFCANNFSRICLANKWVAQRTIIFSKFEGPFRVLYHIVIMNHQ